MNLCRAFVASGRRIWLSVVQQDLLLKMRTDGMAVRDENGRLILECADGSSKPCGFNPDGVRHEIGGLEACGLLIHHQQRGWALTAQGRTIHDELTANPG